MTTTFALPPTVTKRTGVTVEFDVERIQTAVQKCYDSLEETPATPAEVITDQVCAALAYRWMGSGTTPTVEGVQDVVEMTLVAQGEYEAAKHYILYRERHAKHREHSVPDDIRALFDDSAQYFPTSLQQFQFFDKYSRFNWDLMRRETWVETVRRVVGYLKALVEQEGKTLPSHVWDEIEDSMMLQEAMPSMRALAMAGEAALRNSLSIYNCSYTTVDSIDSFVESMIISMAGCGVGFSVERQYVEQLPRVIRQDGSEPKYHLIDDSSDGWAEALRIGLNAWFNGTDVTFNYGLIREAGTPLKVKGGRASGPEPLRFVLDYCRSKILSRQGQTLRTIDAHDIMCVIGGAAVSGGVRRTAMICLYSWDDQEMRDCKSGAFPDHRWNANNSAVWPEVMDQIEYTDQMMAMFRERRGEPGIFSRANAKRTAPARRDSSYEFGTNPCGEINLRPKGLCNLTIAVARPDDTVEDLYRKVEVAAIIGTIQSLAVNFPGMRPEWVKNCIEERLLGVDITGQADCPHLDRTTEEGARLREDLKKHSIAVNERWAKRLGINPSAAITCDKPSGNSSQLLNTASGIHRRWAPFYIRRTRVSANTPVYKVLKDAGVPLSPENGSSVLNASTWVASWPIKAPEGALTRKDFSAIDQCEFWLLNKIHWTEHNPSVTVTYQEHEVLDVINWVWEHKDLIGGMAFLPADDAAYAQAPYEEIDEATYDRLAAEFPKIDFSLLYVHEQTDMTEAAQTVACVVGGDC